MLVGPADPKLLNAPHFLARNAQQSNPADGSRLSVRTTRTVMRMFLCLPRRVERSGCTN
jgi:hypothetical protein